uniref:Reverse transcriptase domain-containing protein n=1 Tax=Xiphophorus maculatus TaxID=8083 RepID=A0A3B5R4M7_XIPMA
MGGDFNVALNSSLDRWPLSVNNTSSINLSSFIQKFNLIDIWREKNPVSRAYTWSNKPRSLMSRIDYWLVSDCLLKNNITPRILTTPLTDHKAISLIASFCPNITPTFKSSYWKLNNSILKNVLVIDKVKLLINHFWKKALINNNFSRNWELLKFEVTKYFREFGTSLSKSRRDEETNVISRITEITQISPENLSENDLKDLIIQQNKLNEIYRRKAEGAFVRSRRKWLEEGEQNTAYFFQLERTRGQFNSIQKLNINNFITDDPQTIAKYCSTFYSELYESHYNKCESEIFFTHLTETKSINDDQRNVCDSPLSPAEVLFAIKHLKLNKSPGVDGLTSEFYITFAEQLAPFLHRLFAECIDNQTLPPTLCQGLLTLIPKPKKDPLLIDNWRPICLLNNDYKILAQIFAMRMKSVLNFIIDETQNGFMTQRHIANNIRLVLDLIDYADLCHDDSLILFLDFRKAFDTIEHNFVFQTLEKFGFGPYFCAAIKTMYKNANCSIKLHVGTSPRFDLKRGVRQGCPLSPYLFLICSQLLSDFIKLNHLKGISFADKNIIISQLADDTTLFLKDASQVSLAINIVEKFSRASGLYLNIDKCELLALKNCNKPSIYNIPVKESVTYLGIMINKDQDSRNALNFNPIVENVQKKLNSWLQRDLSIQGRILLTKAEGISRLTYPALSLSVNKQTIDIIDKMLYRFVWKNRIHYIRKSILMNSFELGGLNCLDFSTLNNTFKINWIKQFLKNPTSIWNFIPNYLFSKLGGLKFILLCNYKIEKLPIKLSNFHKQMLLSWSLIYKHNFSPHRYYIWNNGDILYKHKSLFLENWFEHGIILVQQLFRPDGVLMSYSELLERFGLPIPPKEYALVFDAIPSGVMMLLKSSATSVLTPPGLDAAVTNVGQICFSTRKRKNNRDVRALFQKDIVSVPNVISYWNNFAPNLNWKKIWCLPSKYLIINKIKEVSFKIIHRFYPCKFFLQRYKKDIDTNCSFCQLYVEDLCHLFWSCYFSCIFWQDICTFISQRILDNFSLTYINMLFGFFSYPTNKTKHFYIINLILLVAKYHIHKSKFSNQKPRFSAFKVEFKQYITSLQYSRNRKAIKTVDMCSRFNIFLS